VTLQYDWLNRLTNMVDASGTTKYAYTAGGLLWTEDGPFSSDTVTNSYQNRLRTALALQHPSGLWTNGFGYDLAGRLTNVTSQAGSYGYGLAGAGMLVKRLNLPGGGYITNSHDVLARLTGTYLKNSGGTTFRSHEYTYNGAHQRTRQTWADGTTVDYTYDLIGQLKAADSSVYGEDLGYAYDAAWNLNRRTNDGAVGYFHVNVKNELTNALGTALTYDANGSATGLGGGVTCAYDDENRLIQRLYYQYSWMHATNGDQRTDLVYDGQGRLRKRLEYYIPAIQQGTNPPPDSLTLGLGVMGLPSQPNWTLESETWYVYDGKRVIQERNGSNTPQVIYTRGTDLSGSLEGAGGIGGLLARSEGSTQASYFADGNGNITSLSGGNLAVVASYRYDPYGNLLFKSGAWADTNVYRFSNKECHVKSGLYYYLYRFYDPILQRWLNRDPLGEPGFELVKGHEPDLLRDGPNLYAFVRNNSVNRIDPFGLATQDKIDEIKKAIALAQQIREILAAAQSGKGCACLDTATAAMCQCALNAFIKENAQEMAQCSCLASPDPRCFQNAINTTEAIIKAKKAAEKAKEAATKARESLEKAKNELQAAVI